MNTKFITTKVKAYKNSSKSDSLQYIIQNKELMPFAGKWVIIKVMEIDYKFIDKELPKIKKQ